MQTRIRTLILVGMPRCGVWRTARRAVPAFIALLLLALPTVVQAQFDYTVNPGGASVTITGYTGSGGDVTIPATINGLAVASIGDDAFDDTPLTSVAIPNSVTTIGHGAFEYCNNLTSIFFTGDAPTADSSAFSGDSSVTIYYLSGTLGWGATYDGASAVMLNGPPQFGATGNGLAYAGDNTKIIIIGYTGSGGNVFIPATINSLPVTAIGGGVFQQQYNLTSVTIPNSVTSIGIQAFYDCEGLTNVTIGNGVATIGDGAFVECFNLASVFFEGDAPASDSSAFDSDPATVYYLSGTLGWSNTFAGLSTVMLNGPPQFGATADGWDYVSDGIKIIITGYTSPDSDVTIPPAILGLPVIGVGSFALEYLSVTSVVIPSSVSNIGNEAFEDCNNLANVTIPDSVTDIGNQAFYNCVSLTNVTIGSNVTTIGDSAFQYCYDLTSVTIPNSVTTIGDYAFYYDNSLTNAIIGGGITNIGYYAFGCANLTSVFFTGNAPSVVQSNAFSYLTGGHWIPRRSVYDPATVYYLSGTLGWSNTFAGLPTVMLNGPPQFGATDDGWNYLSDGVQIIITGYTGFDSDVTIPPAILGLPVIGVGPFALENSSITSVVIPDSVSNIGSGAFKGCYSLTSVTIPNSVTGIGNDAFYNCQGLTNVTIGSSVATIGDGAFEDCYYLASVTIPGSVTNIGNFVFAECYDLTAITVAAQNPVYSSVNGVLFDKNQTTLIQYPIGGIASSYVIPNGVTNIASGAFQECYLTNVTIGSGVVTIEDGAFEYCYNLTSMTIPNSVMSIGNETFYDCEYLTNVTIGGGVATIGDGAFEDCYDLTDVIIPNSVTNIGNQSFYYCDGLRMVTIGSSVTSIGDGAFEYCYDLTSIFFTGDAPSADSSAFSGDSYATAYYLSGTLGWSNGLAGLPTVMLNGPPQFGTTLDGWNYVSDGVQIIITRYTGTGGNVVVPATINGLPVTTIGGGAFQGQYNLTSVTIPNSVTSVGVGAFEDCYSLTSIFFEDNAPAADPSAFYGDSTAVYFQVGTVGWGSTFAGLPALPWDLQTQCSLMITNGAITIISFKGLSGTENIPDMFNGLPVTSISDGAFAHSGLTSVTIGGNVTSIGIGAFEYCYGLTNAIIPDGVTSIGDYMFYNDPQLASVTIGNSVTNIGNYAFLASTALTGITIPNSVIAIGTNAFNESGLTNVTIGSGVTTIGDYAFFDNVHLTGVTIGNSVTSIGQYAFAYNAGLTGITIPDSVITIGDFAFAYSGLTNVTTGNGITSIGKYEFYDDTGLAGVVIGSNVTNIEDHAFGDCPSLTGVFFMGNAPTIDSSAFGFAPATAYYLPGTTGWGDFSANTGVPTALWLPKVQAGDASFSVQNHHFGFNIAWASGQTVVVEACTNLSNPVWLPVSTNTLVGGTSHFSDPQSSNYPARVYRLRSQ